MRYKITFSEKYRVDMNAVYDYILNNWWENSVDNFVFELNNKLDTLETMPEIYAVYRINDNYRFFTNWNFLILYFVNKGQQTVVVDRIIHGSRNISELL